MLVSELHTNRGLIELGVKASEILANKMVWCMEFVKTWHNGKVVHIKIKICVSTLKAELQTKSSYWMLKIYLLAVSGQSSLLKTLSTCHERALNLRGFE
jgi:hypothetical protein